MWLILKNVELLLIRRCELQDVMVGRGHLQKLSSLLKQRYYQISIWLNQLAPVGVK